MEVWSGGVQALKGAIYDLNMRVQTQDPDDVVHEYVMNRWHDAWNE